MILTMLLNMLPCVTNISHCVKAKFGFNSVIKTIKFKEVIFEMNLGDQEDVEINQEGLEDGEGFRGQQEGGHQQRESREHHRVHIFYAK
jgi:hypothetical protein